MPLRFSDDANGGAAVAAVAVGRDTVDVALPPLPPPPLTSSLAAVRSLSVGIEVVERKEALSWRWRDGEAVVAELRLGTEADMRESSGSRLSEVVDMADSLNTKGRGRDEEREEYESDKGDIRAILRQFQFFNLIT